MEYQHNFHQTARIHDNIPISQNDLLTFQQGPGDPGPLNVGAFSTIPHGIYSPFPVGSDGVNNPVPTGSVGSRGHGLGYPHATPLDSSYQPPIEDSFGRRNDSAEPAAWLTARTPLDRPLQESAEPARSPNGSGAPQRSMRRADKKSFKYAKVTPVYRCKWQGCPGQTNFRRSADLLRHLKTIHIDPEAYPCPGPRCDQSFGRKDHLDQHVRRRH